MTALLCRLNKLDSDHRRRTGGGDERNSAARLFAHSYLGSIASRTLAFGTVKTGLRLQSQQRGGSISVSYTDPDAFATAGDIANFIAAFADAIAAPVRCGVTATTMRRQDGRGGFRVETSEGPIEARNVVVATGPFQRPVIPPLLPKGADIFEVHASAYRNPDQLPDGAVLVVGSGASGSQIADELIRTGRRVYLAGSRHGRLPRRYRGHTYR